MTIEKVYSALQSVSVALQTTEIKKSGKNKFAGFKYFELGDFLPAVNKLFLEHKLSGYVSFNLELASLVITSIEDGSQVTITSPMMYISMKGANEIQNLGAVQTYQRRYLYLAALGIVENDIVDSREMKSEPVKSYATVSQLKEIRDIVGDDNERGQKILDFYKVKKYQDLTIREASKCIIQLKK